MKHDSSNRWSTQFRKRASPSSFAIFLAFLFFVQLISTFHGENHKLLELLKKIIVPESEPTDVARERRRGINPVAISNNNSPPNQRHLNDTLSQNWLRSFPPPPLSLHQAAEPIHLRRTSPIEFELYNTPR